MWNSQILLKKLYKYRSTSNDTSTPVSKKQKTNIPPSITLKHTTREIKEKILTWERAKHDLQKMYTNAYKYFPKAFDMVYDGKFKELDDIDDFYEELTEFIIKQLPPGVDPLHWDVTRESVEEHIVIGWKELNDKEYWYIESFFYESGRAKDHPVWHVFAPKILQEIIRIGGAILLEDAAFRNGMNITLYRWLVLSQEDENIELLDERTSYYSKFGFKRVNPNEYEKPQMYIDGRNKINEMFKQLWKDNLETNIKIRNILLNDFPVKAENLNFVGVTLEQKDLGYILENINVNLQ